MAIDECHRGGAREDSAWREILDYFEPAIQPDLTASGFVRPAMSPLCERGLIRIRMRSPNGRDCTKLLPEFHHRYGPMAPRDVVKDDKCSH